MDIRAERDGRRNIRLVRSCTRRSRRERLVPAHPRRAASARSFARSIRIAVAAANEATSTVDDSYSSEDSSDENRSSDDSSPRGETRRGDRRPENDAARWIPRRRRRRCVADERSSKLERDATLDRSTARARRIDAATAAAAEGGGHLATISSHARRGIEPTTSEGTGVLNPTPPRVSRRAPSKSNSRVRRAHASAATCAAASKTIASENRANRDATRFGPFGPNAVASADASVTAVAIASATMVRTRRAVARTRLARARMASSRSRVLLCGRASGCGRVLRVRGRLGGTRGRDRERLADGIETPRANADPPRGETRRARSRRRGLETSRRVLSAVFVRVVDRDAAPSAPAPAEPPQRLRDGQGRLGERTLRSNGERGGKRRARASNSRASRRGAPRSRCVAKSRAVPTARAIVRRASRRETTRPDAQRRAKRRDGAVKDTKRRGSRIDDAVRGGYGRRRRVDGGGRPGLSRMDRSRRVPGVRLSAATAPGVRLSAATALGVRLSAATALGALSTATRRRGRDFPVDGRDDAATLADRGGTRPSSAARVVERKSVEGRGTRGSGEDARGGVRDDIARREREEVSRSDRLRRGGRGMGRVDASGTGRARAGRF